MLDPNDSTLLRASHLLRSAWSATLLYDQSPFETKCMLDPRDGVYIVSIVEDALDATDLVLASPRDSFDSRIRISITLDPDTTEEQRDRFTAYHLPATKPLLARGSFEFAKIDSGEVVTSEDCSLRNPLINEMGSLCKVLNSNRDLLAKVCKESSGVEHESPLAVGVDHIGIDVRARFGLVRIVLPEPIEKPDDAHDCIERLLASCR